MSSIMSKKLLAAFILGASASSVWSQDTQTSVSTEQLTENPFIVEMNTEHVQRSNSFKNINNKLMPELGYKFVPGTSLSVFTEFETNYTQPSQFSTIVPRFQHQIFTKAENDLDFGVDLRYYSFLKGSYKANEEASGYFNARTNTVLPISDSLSITNKNKMRFYNTFDRWAVASDNWTQTYNHEFRVFGTYAMGKLKAELEAKYISFSGQNVQNKYGRVSNYKSFGAVSDDIKSWNTSETFYAIPRAIYEIEDGFEVELGLAVDMFQSHDGRTFAQSNYIVEPKIRYTFNKFIGAELMGKIPANIKAGQTLGNETSIELDLKLAAF